MKIAQLFTFLFLLVQLNLNGQRWTLHEVETEPSTVIIQDREGHIQFANGLSIFKYDGDTWTETQLESFNPTCEALTLIRDPYSCDILAYSPSNYISCVESGFY